VAATGAGRGEGADDFAAAGKFDGPDFSFAPHFDRDTGRQRIGHRDADAMQAAGEGVGRVAGVLVELAAGMQSGEGQHHHRYFLVGMEADRNAATVVGDGNRAIEVEQHVEVFRMAAECLVGGVVDDLLDDVRRRVGAGVHAGALAHRLQSLEDTEGGFVVSGACSHVSLEAVEGFRIVRRRGSRRGRCASRAGRGRRSRGSACSRGASYSGVAPAGIVGAGDTVNDVGDFVEQAATLRFCENGFGITVPAGLAGSGEMIQAVGYFLRERSRAVASARWRVQVGAPTWSSTTRSSSRRAPGAAWFS
jgi:hypothetical protein